MNPNGSIYEVHTEIADRGIMRWENDCDNLARLAIAARYKIQTGKYYDTSS